MRRSSPRTTFTNVVPKVSPANVPLLVRRRVTTPTAPVETKVQFVTEKRSTSVMLSAGCPPTEWPAQSSVTSCVSWTSRHVPDEDRSAVTTRLPGAVIAPQLVIRETVAPVTVTVAVAVRDGSAWLAATTWNVPDACGAVYRPLESTNPPAAPSKTDHTTPLSLEPETVATKRCMAPGARDASVGEIATEIEGAPDPGEPPSAVPLPPVLPGRAPPHETASPTTARQASPRIARTSMCGNLALERKPGIWRARRACAAAVKRARARTSSARRSNSDLFAVWAGPFAGEGAGWRVLDA